VEGDKAQMREDTKPISRREAAGMIGVAGLVIAVMVPIWQNYFVQTPHLSIEINAITKDKAEDAGVPLTDLPPMMQDYYRKSRYQPYPYQPFRLISEVSTPAVTPAQLDLMLAQARQDNHELPRQIDEWTKNINKIPQTIEGLTVESARELNLPLSGSGRQIYILPSEFEEKARDKRKNQDYFNEKLQAFEQAYHSELDTRTQQFLSLQQDFPSAERKINEIKDAIEKQQSIFTVTAAMTNSGRVSVSVKKPALLRIYIGRENYVDLRMLIDKYESVADIPAQGTKIVSLKSYKISALPEDDQRLIGNYWNKNVGAILFMEDVLGHVHSSNAIAFAEGVYQKLIYDSLAVEASKPVYLDTALP
jgi:hypothetical protein